MDGDNWKVIIASAFSCLGFWQPDIVIEEIISRTMSSIERVVYFESFIILTPINVLICNGMLLDLEALSINSVR